MTAPPIAPETVLEWFRAIPNGQGAAVTFEDAQYLAHWLELPGSMLDIETVLDPKYEALRRALETIIEIAPGFLANGDVVLRREQADDHDDTMSKAHEDMQRDLRSVLEATRTLLLKNRFQYQPARKKNLNGFWHRAASDIGDRVCEILAFRNGGRKFGLSNAAAPAIAIVREAMIAAYSLGFEFETIVRGIRLYSGTAKIYKELVSARTDLIRGRITPDTPEHPGELESDDEQPIPAADRSRSQD